MRADSEDMLQITVGRGVSLAPHVLFLNGLSGTGKTMMGPLLSSFKRVEVQRFEYLYDYLCELHYLGRIEPDAVAMLARLYVDLSCYDAMLGREVNFRWHDLSGVLNNPGGMRYLRRLFHADGETVMERVQREQPILHIHCHYSLGVASPLFEALGDRWSMVEMVRHPLYLLEQNRAYIERFGTDPRDFTICLHYEGRFIPWFAKGWEETYLSSNGMDRVIYMMDHLTRLARQMLDTASPAVRSRIVVVPFERLVLDPWPSLRQIEGLLGTTVTSWTPRTLRKQKIPRRLTTAGRDLPIYRRYNWVPPDARSTEREQLKKRLDYAQREATSRGLDVLERMCADYERRYWSPES